MTSTALAANLEFTIDIPEKIFYPNETIPINLSIINRETSFSARDATLSIDIGKRSYFYELGDIKATDNVLKKIKLPEFPPGDYIIKGELNYTGFFDERDISETYNSFHVRFPEMDRLPRNIVIKKFSIPKNITAGEIYFVSITVSNEGNVAGDLIISVNSLDVDKTKKIHLEQGKSDTLSLQVEFYNPGVSNVEARVYAVVNNVKYLLSFDTATVFVKESNAAKLLLDKIEMVDESDNKINQEDTVKLKISLLNNGTWMASNVKATLKSPVSEIEIIQAEGDFSVIPKNGFSSNVFEIKTKDAPTGSKKLSLDVEYTDGLGSHSTTFEIPITISEGSDACNSDSDCFENQMCSDRKCVVVPCECGDIINHQCQQYACCIDLDCDEGYSCSSEKHVCEPSKEIKADVLIVTSSKLRTNKDYEETLREYRKTILEEDLTSFYINVDSQKVQDIFNIQPANPSNWRSVKGVLDKIIYKVEPDYLLILGGVDIIPQPPAKTDAEIPTIPPSDDRYADTDLDGIPDIAVGRIPTVPRKNEPNIVMNTLKTAVKIHKVPRITSKFIIANPCGTAGSCNRHIDNNYISEIIFDKSCEINERCKVPPPYCLGGFLSKCSKKSVFENILINSNLLYFGCHGSGTSFASNDDDGWHQILSGNELYGYKLNNTFVMTTACHGGTIDCEEVGCLGTEGTGFAFLANGAGVYIANTRYGYRYRTPRLYGSILKKMKIGETVGSALLKMKQEKLRNCWTERCKASIYEIQLYGDPTIKLTGV